jgi:hypothetical protein
MIPRGTYFGRPIGAQPKDEAEHFIRCPACNGWIDCRDLGDACKARRNLLEHCEPFTCDACLVQHEAGEITAWPRQTCDETCADRVGNSIKYDWNRTGLSLHSSRVSS